MSFTDHNDLLTKVGESEVALRNGASVTMFGMLPGNVMLQTMFSVPQYGTDSQDNLLFNYGFNKLRAANDPAAKILLHNLSEVKPNVTSYNDVSRRANVWAFRWEIPHDSDVFFDKDIYVAQLKFKDHEKVRELLNTPDSEFKDMVQGYTPLVRGVFLKDQHVMIHLFSKSTGANTPSASKQSVVKVNSLVSSLRNLNVDLS